MFSAYHRIGENRYRQRIGLDFEDFSPGQRFRHRPGVTLSQQDNADEALDTLNGAMLHYDAHYAAATSWQRPLMVSTLTLAAADRHDEQDLRADGARFLVSTTSR